LILISNYLKMSDYENSSKTNCIKMHLKSDVGVIMALK
jgi:hypothetical protein